MELFSIFSVCSTVDWGADSFRNSRLIIVCLISVPQTSEQLQSEVLHFILQSFFGDTPIREKYLIVDGGMLAGTGARPTS